MAQWLGQFTGRSHATRVEDAEAAMRQAVSAFHAGAPDAKALRKVQKFAERLLRARLQFLKARIADGERIPTAEELTKREQELARLRRAESAARAGGVGAILGEFGIAE
ncbi:hypothetical protein LZC95_27470 [Pendulispora brunnea]|uniref:Uncharacterized protein n=1 Tax=Pendulispora brunnea TaxID=2905690 RepID=A0ABZ2K0B9_9BACT